MASNCVSNEAGNVQKETVMEALNTIIQLQLEKTLEKKHAIDLQKKHLHKLFHFFFIFLSLLFLSLSHSSHLQCRHCWIPITLLSLSHTLRSINAFKYQRRCHKLTLAFATERLREIKLKLNSNEYDAIDFEIHYQEPPESYFGKFKRNWALHFGFLIIIYAFMVSSSVVLLCF